ncbi:MAG: SOS response-associated peptidase [Ignavibacteria bacterium]|nr:SOS response-associated peptidase [Ignavibacteria bacterium]
MCSRFENKETGLSIFTKIEKGSEYKVINNAPENLKQISIAPNDDILIIKNSEGNLEMNKKTWGIKFDEKSPLIFNSRIETIISKNYWNNLFDKNRCLIPATAFYEWKQTGNIKIPHRIALQDYGLFFIAGLYIKVNNVFCATIITTEPNTTIAKIHNRMPVIMMQEEGIEFLLSGKEEALSKCKPLDDRVKIDAEIAKDILTAKQKEVLSKNKKEE